LEQVVLEGEQAPPVHAPGDLEGVEELGAILAPAGEVLSGHVSAVLQVLEAEEAGVEGAVMRVITLGVVSSMLRAEAEAVV
jgi:hypothetical protein